MIHGPPVYDRRTDTPVERALFAAARRAETSFAIKLRKIAKHCGEIVNGFDQDSPEFLSEATTALKRYAEILKPWARSAARRVIADVSRRDAKAWAKMSEQMGESLRLEIEKAPTGAVMRRLMEEQVELITSLPLEAAQRVHKLVLEAAPTAGRASEIARELRATGQVTAARATLIARTEVGRASTMLTAARAKHIGSQGYIWRTARDADVRSSHKKMEGKFVAWDKPAQLSDGTVAHAGAIYNCRCWPEPVLPDTFD